MSDTEPAARLAPAATKRSDSMARPDPDTLAHTLELVTQERDWLRQVLDAAQGALTCQRIEALVSSPKPLRKVLDGMARRGRLQRVGPARFAVAEAVLAVDVSRNGTGP